VEFFSCEPSNQSHKRHKQTDDNECYHPAEYENDDWESHVQPSPQTVFATPKRTVGHFVQSPGEIPGTLGGFQYGYVNSPEYPDIAKGVTPMHPLVDPSGGP